MLLIPLAKHLGPEELSLVKACLSILNCSKL